MLTKNELFQRSTKILLQHFSPPQSRNPNKFKLNIEGIGLLAYEYPILYKTACSFPLKFLHIYLFLLLLNCFSSVKSYCNIFNFASLTIRPKDAKRKLGC